MDSDVVAFAQVMTVIVGSAGALTAIGLVARALWQWGSRMERSAVQTNHASDVHLQELRTAVDTIAIEVERISEAQRFMVSLLAESTPARRPAELAPPDRSGRTNTPH